MSRSCKKRELYDIDSCLTKIEKIETKLETISEDFPSGYCFCLFDSPQTCAKVLSAIKYESLMQRDRHY